MCKFRMKFPLILLVFVAYKIEHVEPRNSLAVVSNATCNPSYLDNFRLEFVNNTLNLDMDLKKPLISAFKMHVQVLMRLASSKRYQRLFQSNVDLCVIASDFKDSLLKKWFLEIVKSGNFKYDCPVMPDHYYLRNWKIEGTLSHYFLYPGDYRGKLRFYFGKMNTKSEERVLELLIDTMLK